MDDQAVRSSGVRPRRSGEQQAFCSLASSSLGSSAATGTDRSTAELGPAGALPTRHGPSCTSTPTTYLHYFHHQQQQQQQQPQRSTTRQRNISQLYPIPSPIRMTSSVASSASEAALERDDYRRMEQWLDEHTDFVHDYFARKASRSMIDAWLLNKALSQAPCSEHSSTDSNSTSKPNSKPSSGANTPVRKISAQEFERGGLLRPMVSTIDGTPTFLGSGSVEPASSNSKSRKSRSELKALDERELLYELVIDICNDLEVTSLCYKILQNVSLLLNADRCSLFLVKGEPGSDRRCLVSQLFDVNIHSSIEECKERSEEIHVPWGTGIIGYVAKTGQSVNIADAYQDSRFNNEIDLKTGYKTRSILSMPIKDSEGSVVGVAQAVNKISNRDEPFDEHDEKVFASYLAFCGIGIRNAQLYERSQLENRRNQLLLDLARLIFEEQSNVANLIHKIMMHTQSLLQCERCQVLLVDDNNPRGVFSQVFDLQASDFENDDSYHREGTQEPRFPINIGITGYVAATGETLNIPDAYKDCRFDPSVDKETDFTTRSILCMPIKNALGYIVGVAQLVNKLDGTPFNRNDQNLFEAFAIFCGMGINNTQMYEKAVKAIARQNIALEVLSYHASAPSHEVQRLKKLSIPSAQHFHLYDYSFSDFTLDDDDTIKATIRMFIDLNLLERFHVNYEVFCRWVLSVKKNYRNVTYHNWRHAFNVAQSMFAMIKAGGVKNMLSDEEILALLVGCLSHDLDHRGTNNQFQIKTMSPLAQLYSTSTMEHHHFDQCIMILSTKGNEIFAGLNETEYERVIFVLENAILATDLALYFRYRGEFFNLVESNFSGWNREEHRDLLRGMMMTACDVAAITKPWEVQQRVAELIANEFFEQGDLEKTELHIKPIDMMNRDKKDELPSMQVGFIDSICMPVYQAFSKLNPGLKPMLEGCIENRERWQKLADKRSKNQQDVITPENHNKDALEDSHKNGNHHIEISTWGDKDDHDSFSLDSSSRDSSLGRNPDNDTLIGLNECDLPVSDTGSSQNAVSSSKE